VSKLKPAFSKNGTTTAGNSSQVSDGAAAVLLMTRRKANELKLPVLARFRSYAVAGVLPDIMGIGPAVAIPQALAKAGVSIADIDVFEINEAFASQATYCVEKLGINSAKLNPNGILIHLHPPTLHQF
jgi:acetyl-CoA acyltransferase 1